MESLRVNIKKKEDKSYFIYFDTPYIKNCVLDIKRKNSNSKYAIITDSKVKKLYGIKLQKQLKRAGINSEIFPFHPGERSKNLNQVEKLINALIRAGFSRNDTIITLGGGVVGDIGGLVSSLFMRGIPYVQIPTTLLAMVDSSVGGKTGVDCKFGKNLIGTFNQPENVYIDVDFLKTLSKKQIKNGIAEIIKYGVIAKPLLLRILDKKNKEIMDLDKKILKKIIRKCIAIKASIVQEDEKESNIRKILNYGHTIGHAIEVATNFKIQHGEGVSIGISIANTIAVEKNLLKKKEKDYIDNIIKSYKLPHKLPKHVDLNKIINSIMYDKKTSNGKTTFIIPRKLGKVFLNDKIRKKDIIKACKKHI